VLDGAKFRGRIIRTMKEPTRDPTIELWERVKAKEELEKRGYVYHQCGNCRGEGTFYYDHFEQNRECPYCHGKGGWWDEPVTK
jgi:DnaJ-class molecular chaperone